MHATTATSAERAPRWQAILQRWPSALGLVVAALQLAGDPDRQSPPCSRWRCCATWPRPR
jgi:hypothetical protein